MEAQWQHDDRKTGEEKDDFPLFVLSKSLRGDKMEGGAYEANKMK